ncbi:hypothetical protein D9M70_417160 [compost metagenome]
MVMIDAENLRPWLEATQQALQVWRNAADALAIEAAKVLANVADGRNLARLNAEEESAKVAYYEAAGCLAIQLQLEMESVVVGEGAS